MTATRRPRAGRSAAGATRSPEATPRAAEAAAAAPQAAVRVFPPPTATSEELAASNLALAQREAQRMAARTGMGFDDLYMVALVGLLKGCRLYDPCRLNPANGQPYALSTCCVPYIQGAMKHYLRDRGHTSGVRFPDRWRDRAPTVRRLAAEGKPPAVIAEAVALPAAEVEAILAAQATPSPFDPDAQGFSWRDPEPVIEEQDGCSELEEVLAIADEAHARLGWADRQMLEVAWQQRPLRLQRLARLPHGQFMRQVAGVIRGSGPVPREGQQDLAIVLPAPPGEAGATARRITRPAEIVAAVEQLALFAVGDACLDRHSGKTAAAGVGGAAGAAAGNQPSDEQRRAAELPASVPGGGDRGSRSGSRLLGSAAGGREEAPPAEGAG